MIFLECKGLVFTSNTFYLIVYFFKSEDNESEIKNEIKVWRFQQSCKTSDVRER